jgi:hypothetical protein
MQIKELKILEVEISKSRDLTQKEIESLLLRAFAKGFRDLISYSIRRKESCTSNGNYIIRLEIPTEAQHVEGNWYSPTTFEAELREVLCRVQALFDQYQQYCDFGEIKTRRNT